MQDSHENIILRKNEEQIRLETCQMYWLIRRGSKLDLNNKPALHSGYQTNLDVRDTALGLYQGFKPFDNPAYTEQYNIQLPMLDGINAMMICTGTWNCRLSITSSKTSYQPTKPDYINM